MSGALTKPDMTKNSDSIRSSRWWLRQDSQSVVIDAPAERIYALVADLPRMGDWSPECRSVEWLEGSVGPAEGATFIGHNRGGPRGLMKWSRRGRVLSADPGCEFAFVTEEGGRESTEWRYRLEPVEGGHGSPSPTSSDGYRPGRASSTSRPTAPVSCAMPCSTHCSS